jgi:Lrp/AsnC family transcriptional regulator, leucine-responsive regulatory protein
MSTKRASLSSFTHENPTEAIDEIDIAIIHVLQHRGRATNDEVGDAVGLSPSAASRRIHSLEHRGIITGYQVLIENKILGADITVFVRVTLERQSATALHAFDSRIRRCSSVTSCHLMAGEYDYMLLVKVASITDYERLHQEELSRLPGVRRIESSFAVRNVLEREISIRDR